jgi:outer membrane receptor protein involved in Fe transport
MTTKKIPTSLLFLFAILHVSLNHAQTSDGATITGVVREYETEEPMEFVNVVLYQTGFAEQVKGTVTDQDGHFRFDGILAGVYYLQMSFIGFENKTSREFRISSQDQEIDLQSFDIQAASYVFEQVEVVGQRTTYGADLRKKVYNVEKDLMSGTSSIQEILQNLPSVRVDVNGQLSLRGTSNIAFFINGRPSALLRSGGSAALQQIPANSIERVEVITSPSAKYRPDGLGGIINIVLKDANREGFNGTMQGSLGNLERYNGNVTLNYGTGDVNVFGSYGIKHSKTPQEILDQRIDRDGSGREISNFMSRSDATFEQLSHLINAGIIFPIGENQIEVSGEYFYGRNDDNSLTNWMTRDGEGLSTFSVDRAYDGFEEEYDIGIALEREFENEDHSFAIELNFAGYDEKEDNYYTERFITPNSLTQRSRNLILKGGPVTEFAVEYARPVGLESELELGYLAEFAKDDIQNVGENLDPDGGGWTSDLLKTNRFKFKQSIHALYAAFGHAIEDFSFTAGLRAEQVYITSNLLTTGEEIPNDYFRLYPSLHLTYEFSDDEELGLGYSKRVNRADPDEHNPFPEYDDPRTRDAGNPRLLPEVVHAVELGYRLQKPSFSIMPTLYFRQKKDGFTEIREIQDDTVLHTSFINFANESSAVLEMVFRGTVSPDVNLLLSANAFYNELDAADLGFNKKKSQVSWDSKLAANINLTRNTFAQVNAHYLSSRLTPQGEFQPLFLVNLGLRQDFWKKRASLLFTVSDVFASLEFESQIDNPNLFWNTEYGRNNQIFHIGFSYRFGESFNYRQKGEQINYEDEIEHPDSEKPEEEEEEEEEEGS